MKPYVIYHFPCFDGFTAAWSAHAALGENAEYIPWTYGQLIPELEPKRRIFFLDVCFSPEQLDKLDNPITILDHHLTSMHNTKNWLESKPGWIDIVDTPESDSQFKISVIKSEEPLLYIDFNLYKSGAMLSWEYFNGTDNVPRLVRYVQDRDLLALALPETNAVSNWLGLFPWTFAAWDEANTILTQNFDVVLDHAKVAEQAHKRYVEALLDSGIRCCVNIGGYSVPVVNAPKPFGSDVCVELLKKYSEAKFVAYYWDRGDGLREWGLRSRGDFNVAKVAEQYGGGGHHAASGFTVSYTDDLDLNSRGSKLQ